MAALEESTVMGRRAKLLKPHSWDAADISLFFISPSVSLSHTQTKQFSISISLSLTVFLYPTSALSLYHQTCSAGPHHRPLSIFLSISHLLPTVVFLLRINSTEEI